MRGDCACLLSLSYSCRTSADGAFATDFAADAVLIECFARLTDRFLVPLNRYFNSLLPAATSDVTCAPSRTLTFNQSAFLHSVKARRNEGGQLQLRRSKVSASSVHHLYERFLRSSNFATWLHERTDAANAAVHSRYLDNLQNVDLESWAKDKDDKQLAELATRIDTEVVSFTV
jgi:hypothetical protein